MNKSQRCFSKNLNLRKNCLAVRRGVFLAPFIVASLSLAFAPYAAAETMDTALARAYKAHPSLNAQRAGLRATDEGVPQALSGYRPRISATGDVGLQSNDARSPLQSSSETLYPRGVSLQIDQTLWNGNRTASRVRSAESAIYAGREQLRVLEQTILFQAAQTYMSVLRDTAVLNLRNNNVEVLEEQLRQAKDRFAVGEITRTDVAQSEARLAGSRSQVSVAQAQLKSSLALYRQRIGSDPKKLAPGKNVEKLLPKSLDAAVNIALKEHPSIHASLHNVDFAEYNVKTAEGELYPTIGVQGRLNHRYDVQSYKDERTSASIVGSISIPLYEGGEVTSRVRAAKEIYAQRRIEVDVARDTVRAEIIGAWGQLDAAKAQIVAAQAQVQAAEIALSGVREEAKVGQRTTLDILNAQQELLDARVTLITAQRDRIVTSYQTVQALGRLSFRTLSLKVTAYKPEIHFDQVRDKLWGTTTPDGQ
jgi:outer membrane protein